MVSIGRQVMNPRWLLTVFRVIQKYFFALTGTRQHETQLIRQARSTRVKLMQEHGDFWCE